MSAGAERHRSLAETGWQPARPGPLPSGILQLWRVNLNAISTDRYGHCYDLLAPDERERAARFRFEGDRRGYVITRGSLREVLAVALSDKAALLRFRYSAYGKPFLEDAGDLVFNVSHAGGYALIAVGRGLSVGVDLESVDPTITVENLVERFFAVPERAAVLSLPERDRHTAFFRTWTRKEAFIKAQGAGLSLPLDRFSVTVAPDAALAVEWINWQDLRPEEWLLRSFTVAPDLPGALCARLVAGDSSPGRLPATPPRIKFSDFPHS